MNALSEYLSFHANAILVLAGCVMLGIGAGVMGCFTFLRRRSLLGDALAHSALPGVCAAFMLTGTKDPFVILAGAMLSCWLGALSIDLIVRYTRVKEDSALGMVLSVFFGLGILLLTHIQQSGEAAQSGLDKFLFGQAAAIVDEDVALLAGVGLLIVAAVILFYKDLKLVAFDPVFARATGRPVALIELALSTLVVLAVAVGLQAVGVVLMAAMLVTPAAAARYWTDRLSRMLMLAGLFGALAGAAGTLISLTSARMPTGPWMVAAATSIFFVSLMFAPSRGILGRVLRHSRSQKKTAEENLLRTMYLLGEPERSWERAWSAGDLARYRAMSPALMSRTLLALKAAELVAEPEQGRFALTDSGLARAARLTRLHRLWELYLTERVQIAPDHVHEDAEEIEHILTPELEARLEAVLREPTVDPHGVKIPGVILSAPASEGRAHV